MNVNFTKIILEDAFGADYLEFDFTQGIHSIGGINGAGKTTIYLALAQGLFNKNPKNTKIDDVSNVVTGKPYQITVFFEKGPDKYKVVNSRKTGTITVEMNGKSLSRKTIPQNLELIKEILGDSYESFVGMTYQSTESSVDLVEENSDTARKNFINKILKFDELDSLLTFNKDKLKQLKLVLKGKTTQADSLKSSYLPKREVGSKICIDTLEAEVKSKDRFKKAADKLVEKYREEVQQTQRSLEFYCDYLETTKKVASLQKEMSSIKLPSDTLIKVKEDIAKCTEQITQLKLKQSQVKGKFDSLREPELNCSRCGQPVSSEDALALYEKEKKELTEAYEEFELERKQWEGKLWLAEEYKDTWDRYNKVEYELSRIKIPAIMEVVDETAHSDSLVALKKAQEAAEKANSEYIAKLTELSDAKGKNALVAMVEKFNDEAEAHNLEVGNKLSALDKEIEGIEKRVALIESWIRILGSNGYRVHRMKKFLQVLNQLMAKYSSILSKGKIKCSFYLTEEGKIEFNVVDADKTVPFSGWSAGEKSRVKLACLFAVLEILEVMGSANYNILFLDEVFATLDEQGREGLFEVLAHLKVSGKCIFTVSHNSLVNSVVFDSYIYVSKVDGISRIE